MLGFPSRLSELGRRLRDGYFRTMATSQDLRPDLVAYFKVSFGSRLKKHGPGADWSVHADSETELHLLEELVGLDFIAATDEHKHFALREAGIAWLHARGF